MKISLFIICSIFLLSCRYSFKEKEIIGVYAPIGYKNNFDSIQLKENGVYYRKVYDVKGNILLNMQGKYLFRNKREIQFYSFYLNYDDDLVLFPNLVKDTAGGCQTVLEIRNNSMQFCIGHYEDENCYRKLK